ncbi:hypothetical protein DYBT9623_02960 [Dyadobacter sp. CECT 9623]|uniref:Uncharacterized protein n=1 Tax=Dyadobacter linearis TaxID=2823330 RepID=A0ABN7RCW1_9BACT|nr:hypothetical protein [Dyadobacter sp. CECT 9623]CAG5070220.1 hypothetical protein DYBT9623_02960 [Dyadobacter sp. CECT 9623]
MLDNVYPVTIFDNFLTYEFRSIGPNGAIRKIVRYQEYSRCGYYNLGFGDVDPDTGNESDLHVTNNGDSEKVLRTVTSTLYTFTDNYPDAFVLASGSTRARTRLYRIGISNNLEAIEKDFNLLGYLDDGWQKFVRGTDYDLFLVKRKS